MAKKYTIYEKPSDPPPTECPRCGGVAEVRGRVYVCIDCGCRFTVDED